MLRETIGVLAIVNVALCLVPAGAYLFELPNKLVRRAGWTCMVRAWLRNTSRPRMAEVLIAFLSPPYM